MKLEKKMMVCTAGAVVIGSVLMLVEYLGILTSGQTLVLAAALAGLFGVFVGRIHT